MYERDWRWLMYEQGWYILHKKANNTPLAEALSFNG